MLNADELGEKGESRFKEICADAQLICNKSDRDRTGWDFIVEFPFPESRENEALDGRQAPISCHVQVKTLLAKRNRFEMRLSSAERLAKEKKPSFVYIFRVNENNEFVESFLVHMIDEPLGTILKRLRKESASGGTAKINKKQITLPVNRNSIQLKPTGLDLRNTLESECGHDLDAYIQKKCDQLKNLGFDGPRHRLEGVIHLENTEDIVDAFLGLKKDIPIADVKSFETRFGISLPDAGPLGAGVMNIVPNRMDMCQIQFRNSALDEPVAFSGEAFCPAIPNLTEDRLKVLIKSEFFTLEVKRGSMRVTSDGSQPRHCEPYEWYKFWSASEMLADARGEIRIIFERTNIDLSFPIKAPIKELDLGTCRYWMKVCEAADGLLRKAGVVKIPAVPLHELGQYANDLLLAYSAIKGEGYVTGFDTELIDNLVGVDEVDVLFSNNVRVGSILLAYYGLATYSVKNDNRKFTWNLVRFEPKEIKSISHYPKDYDALIADAKRKLNCENVLQGNLALEMPGQ